MFLSIQTKYGILQNNLDIRLVLEDGEKVDGGIIKGTVKAW
ncbi:MAG: hypothetical protein V7K89_01130 [Nostoc sp.]